MQPVLLCCNLSGDKLKKVRLIAMRFKIRLKTVPEEDTAFPIISVLSGEAGPADALPPFSDEMIVMASFNDALLSSFLKALRQNGAPVALKAVLTPSNENWSFRYLHGELSKEKDAIEKGGKAAHSV